MTGALLFIRVLLDHVLQTNEQQIVDCIADMSHCLGLMFILLVPCIQSVIGPAKTTASDSGYWKEAYLLHQGYKEEHVFCALIWPAMKKMSLALSYPWTRPLATDLAEGQLDVWGLQTTTTRSTSEGFSLKNQLVSSTEVEFFNALEAFCLQELYSFSLPFGACDAHGRGIKPETS